MSSDPSRRPDNRLAQPLSWWAAAVRRATAVLAGAFSLLLAAWLVLHWGILPYIDEWRPQIENRVSRALGLPLTIGSIQVRSAGWVPAFELQDVRILDRQGREALRLARVSAALAPRSLLVLEPRLSQLLVDDVDLDVRRDAQGRLQVAGLDLGAGTRGDDNPVADFLFAQHEIVIRQARLRWTDEQRGGTPLELADAVLVLRNGLRHHELRFDATPPPAWGERFSLRGQFSRPLLSRAGAWRSWRGSLYAELPRIDVAGLGALIGLPFELQAGRGALRAWVDVDSGHASGATVDLALEEVSVRLARELAPLALQRVHGRLAAERDARGVKLAARDFGFATATGLVWPAGSMSLSWLQSFDHTGTAAAGSAEQGADRSGPVTGGQFSADRLDLALMAALADPLPLARPLREGLQALAPQGVLQQISGRWDGPPDAPRHYELRGRATGLTLAAAAPALAGGAGRPGVQQADIEFSATERGGEARLSMADGALEFPGVFAEPRLPLQRLSATVGWKLSTLPDGQRGISLSVGGARFANDDVQGKLDATWQNTPATGAAPSPGVLDMRGTLSQARAERVVRYLPLALPAHVREYVADAVQAGTVSTAGFRVKGDLREFPFTHAAGDSEFNVQAQLKDVRLAYVPAARPPGGGAPAGPSAWPVFTQVQGELVFERNSMRLRDVQAVQGGIQLQGVRGGIKDFHQGMLQIEGSGRAPLPEWLRFVDSSPLADWLGGSLRSASGSGPAELKLLLNVPLAAPGHSTVRGSLKLAGNRVRLRPDVPALEDTRALIEFTEGSLAIAGAKARILGGEASFEGGSAPNGGLRFQGRGTLTAEALQRAPEAAALAPLTARLRGQAAYTLELGTVGARTEFRLSSPLTEMAIDLPAPLDKPAGTSWPLRVQTTVLPDTLPGTTVGRPRDSLQLDLGRVVQARFVRDLSGAAPVIESGAIAVLDELPAADNGVAANLKLGVLDVDAWRRVLGAADGQAGGAAPWLPRTVNLRAERIQLAGRRLNNVVLAVERVDEPAAGALWRSRVQAEQADGNIELRLPAGGGPAQVKARLARLSVPAAEGSGLPALLQSAPSSVPGLDLVIEQLDWHGIPLGRVELLAVNQASRARPAAQEWRLTRLDVDNADASLRASGVWAPGSGGPAGAARRMVLDLRVAVADSGALAERLGSGRAMQGGKGTLTGQLNWVGSPLAPEIRQLGGQLSLALEDGRLLNVEPGAARLLGVLNLQMLPRRLLLDFSDVTGKGFGFERINGEFQLAGGVLSTDSLLVTGTQATVLMQGRVDALQETQELRVVVVPVIGTAGAALAVAAVNPLAGLGTLLAGALLRQPLTAAATREYRVSGGWAQPKIELVDGKTGAAAGNGAPRAPGAE